METLYIVIAVVVGVIVVVFLLRDRITRFFARFSEGEIGVDAAPPRGRQSKRQPSTRVSGNRMVGKRQKLRVTQTNVDVEKNVMKGEDLELNVDNSIEQSSDSDSPQP